MLAVFFYLSLCPSFHPPSLSLSHTHTHTLSPFHAGQKIPSERRLTEEKKYKKHTQMDTLDLSYSQVGHVRYYVWRDEFYLGFTNGERGGGMIRKNIIVDCLIEDPHTT